MDKTSVNDVLEFFTERDIKHCYHSWQTLPVDHTFATWFIPEERFDGHDLGAEYCDYTLAIYIYFKKYKDEGDFALENAFEEYVRPLGKYAKHCGYDSDYDYFRTQYTFELKEWFENGT